MEHRLLETVGKENIITTKITSASTCNRPKIRMTRKKEKKRSPLDSMFALFIATNFHYLITFEMKEDHTIVIKIMFFSFVQCATEITEAQQKKIFEKYGKQWKKTWGWFKCIPHTQNINKFKEEKNYFILSLSGIIYTVLFSSCYFFLLHCESLSRQALCYFNADYYIWVLQFLWVRFFLVCVRCCLFVPINW